MRLEIECATAEAAYEAIKNGDYPVISGNIYLSVSTNCRIICRGTRESSQPHVVAWGSSQPHVEAWGSSQPHVVARGSSQPHVVARESSQPHVVARESSQPRVEAWESSQPRVEAWGSSQPRVEARESSQPHVVAWGSSQPHVEAWGSSQPHVVARESSQPHVVARESSQPRVEASGNCQISARGKVKIKASAMVAVLAMGLLVEVEGGGFVNRVNVSTGKEWCEYYGVEIQDECAVLFKGLDSEFSAQQQSFLYQPGETQSAPDWDPNPDRECGGGLHFSPSPRHTLRFNAEAKKFVACLVPLDTILVHWEGSYPEKVRAPATTKCWEVDINGKAIEAAPQEIAQQ